MKTCFKCHQTKPIDDFYKHPQMADGYLGKCKDCTKLDTRVNRETNPAVQERERAYGHTDAAKQSLRKWRTANKDRVHMCAMASQKVRRAVKKGLLVKANACESCGAETYLEGSHSDYSKPLEVRWLCRRCHRREDSEQPKTLPF